MVVKNLYTFHFPDASRIHIFVVVLCTPSHAFTFFCASSITYKCHVCYVNMWEICIFICRRSLFCSLSYVSFVVGTIDAHYPHNPRQLPHIHRNISHMAKPHRASSKCAGSPPHLLPSLTFSLVWTREILANVFYLVHFQSTGNRIKRSFLALTDLWMVHEFSAFPKYTY